MPEIKLRKRPTLVENGRIVALGSIIATFMVAIVALLLSLSLGEQWPMVVLSLATVAALLLLTLRPGPENRDSHGRRDVELFSGPTPDDVQESWTLDDEDLPDVDEGDLSGIWSGTVRFGGGGAGGKTLIKELAYDGAAIGYEPEIVESRNRNGASGRVADERRIVPLRIALSSYPARVRLLPSEHFWGRDRVVGVEVREHDVVYSALHLRVLLLRADQHRATSFEASLTYGGRGVPKLTSVDETVDYSVELRRTHHFRTGLDGLRMSGSKLLSAPLAQLHPLAV